MKKAVFAAFLFGGLMAVVYAQSGPSYFSAPAMIGLVSSTGSAPYGAMTTTGSSGPSYDNSQPFLLLGLNANGKYYVCGTANPCAGGGGGGGGTIPSTTNLLAGDGAGNAANSTIAASNVPLKNAAQNNFAGALAAQGAATTNLAGAIVFDYFPTDTAARLFAFGPNSSTLGNFEMLTLRSDGTGARYPMAYSQSVDSMGFGCTNGINLGVCGSTITAAGAANFKVSVASPIVKPTQVVVASLPSASSSGAGAMTSVSDGNGTPGTCTGGGSTVMLAISNGTTWTCR